MTADYYAILGVAPTCEDVVIRAAYVALMRRYHSDANSSPTAAERAKAISVAYAALSDPDRRIEYDRARRNGDPYQAGQDGDRGRGKRHFMGRVERVFVLAAVLMLMLLPLYLIRYPITIEEPPGMARAQPDRRIPARHSDPAQSCVSRAAHGLVQERLLRNASRLRRGNRAEFQLMMRDSFVRIEPLVSARARGDGGVDCTAVVVVLLPPGTAATDGRRSVYAELDYSLANVTDGRRATLLLTNADAIARQIATLTRLARTADVREPPPLPPQQVPLPPPVGSSPARLPAVVAPFVPTFGSAPAVASQPVGALRVAAPAAAVTRPKSSDEPRPTDPSINASFNCKFAKGRGETTVCKNRNLAELDRHLGVLYGQSWGFADPEKRAVLLKTREQFIARRDNCQSETCALNVYLGRMREVTDIMSRGSKLR